MSYGTQTDYVVSDATGKIILVGSVPVSMLAIQPLASGQSITLGTADINLDWVSNGAVALRPANPATLSGTTLSNLPNPSTVTINGTAYTVTDGTLDMTFPNPGTYAINVSSPFPLLDANFTHVQ
jgi:hypothetical protein